MSDTVNKIIEAINGLTGAELVLFADRTGMDDSALLGLLRSVNDKVDPKDAKIVYRIRKDGTDDNKKIQAIKHYRNITGEGLRESKDVVDGNRDIPTKFNIDIDTIIEALKYNNTGYEVERTYV